MTLVIKRCRGEGGEVGCCRTSPSQDSLLLEQLGSTGQSADSLVFRVCMDFASQDFLNAKRACAHEKLDIDIIFALQAHDPNRYSVLKRERPAFDCVGVQGDAGNGVSAIRSDRPKRISHGFQLLVALAIMGGPRMKPVIAVCRALDSGAITLVETVIRSRRLDTPIDMSVPQLVGQQQRFVAESRVLWPHASTRVAQLHPDTLESKNGPYRAGRGALAA